MGFCKYFLLFLPVLLGVGYFAVTYTRVAGQTPWLHPMPYGFTEEQIPDDKIAKQVFLVTGTNVGLGLATVEHLARHGAGSIIFTARSSDKLKNVFKRLEAIRKPHTRLFPFPLDLSSLKSVKALTDTLKAKDLIPNIIIANAGIMGPEYALTEDGIESQFQVNHIAQHLLIREFLPALQKISTAENPGRIVIVSSLAHWRAPVPFPLTLAEINNRSNYVAMRWYGLSKLSNVLESNRLSELAGSHVYVNALDPGGVATELAHHFYEHTPLMDTLASAFKKIRVTWDNALAATTILRANFLGALPFPLLAPSHNPKSSHILWQPERASLTILAAATSDLVVTQPLRGRLFSPIGRLQEDLSRSGPSRDLDLSRHLYEFSEQILKERGY